VFVLAAGGLRHLNSVGDGFLGYSPEEIFWKDVLELIHEKDLPRAEALLSEVMHKPGTSLSARLRFRDASGDWRTMDFTAQNVLLEVPDDVGLLVVNVREVALHRDDGPL
jgi:PAS domain-containing protein